MGASPRIALLQLNPKPTASIQTFTFRRNTQMDIYSTFTKENTMRRTSAIYAALCGLMLFLVSPLQAQTQRNASAEKAAQQAATSWVALLDTGKYAQSWTTASEAFKKAVTKDKWAASVKQVRDPLGKVNSRKVKLSQYAKDPAGAPKGEYVMLQYATDFAGKPGAIETVTATREKD